MSSDDEEVMSKNEMNSRVAPVVFTSILIGLGWMVLTDHIPYVPSGNVIDAAFLNTLKFMTALKYLVSIAAVSMIFIPVIVTGFKKESRKNKNIIIGIIAGTVLILGVIFAPHAQGAFHGIVDTPSVTVNVVTEKIHGKGRRASTYTLRFDDGTHGHVSYYHYDRIDEGDDVYVVRVDGEPIGVFRTGEYTLDI